jgi:hypothetical protein
MMRFMLLLLMIGARSSAEWAHDEGQARGVTVGEDVQGLVGFNS